MDECDALVEVLHDAVKEHEREKQKLDDVGYVTLTSRMDRAGIKDVVDALKRVSVREQMANRSGLVAVHENRKSGYRVTICNVPVGTTLVDMAASLRDDQRPCERTRFPGKNKKHARPCICCIQKVFDEYKNI